MTTNAVTSTRAKGILAEGRLTEWLLRIFGLLACGFALLSLTNAWLQDRSRLTVLLLVLIEGYTLLLVLIARRAVLRDMAPMSIVATTYAMLYFVLLDPSGTRRLIPETVGVGLQLAGLAWQLTSKVYLGRAFGLLPARRGIVVAGPYRVVRHPIYLGYLISHLGFLGANFSWRNLAVLVVLYAAQVWRLRREELVLTTSEEYRHYTTKVRWRLVPGVF